MRDEDKTKEQLSDELREARRQLAYLEAGAAEHRRTMEALQESEAKYRALFEASSDALFLETLEGRVLDCNDSACQMFGYSKEELIKLSVAELVPEEIAAILPDVITEELTTGGIFVEALGKRKGGQVFPTEVSTRLTSIKDEQLVIAYVRDISERKQVEKALRESKEWFRTIADFTYDWEYWIGPAGNHIYVSPSCERITGYPSDEFQQDTGLLRTITHPDDRTLIAAHIEEELESPEVYAIDFRIITREGQERWIGHICQPVHGDDGRYLGRRTSNRDITERKRAEANLRQRNRELALLNRASHALVSTLDLDQVLTTVLEEMRHLLGVAACSVWLVEPETDELVCRQATNLQRRPMRGWRLAAGEGIAGWVASHGQSLIVPDTRTDERHFKGVDQHIGVEMRSIISVPLQVKQDVFGALQVVDTEVDRFNTTDLTLLEALAGTAAIAIENARLYEQARQDAETKAVLLNEVNHRVKNNLAAIIGLLYTEQRQANPEEQLVYQSITKGLANRVQGLATVHSMLSASKWTPLLLSELSKQIIRSTLQILPANKQVSVNVPSSPVRVTSDQAHHLALMINELATNTIKHALSNRETIDITICIRLEDSTVLFEFRDNGPGYPEEVLRLNQRHHNVGFELIQNVVRRGLQGELAVYNDNGAVVMIQFQDRGNM